ncbi:MAG: hypothetical protein K0R08_1606 [Solimicrobium sp.]|jgi:hypothetical protein|nr:hypothetical protein [Solimicrobium sp.]
MQSIASSKSSSIQPLPTSQLDNFNHRSECYASELHKVRENQPFMKMMELVFQHCDPANIAKLITYSGFRCNMFSISLEECCRENPGLADEIKQIAGDFFDRPLFSSDFYLKGSETELLFKICNFGISENNEKTGEKIKALKSLLFIDLSSKPLEMAKSFENEYAKSANFRIPNRCAYNNAIKYYIEAAELGNVEAKKSLEAAAACAGVWKISPLKGQIFVALGNIYSREKAKQELINQYYETAWKILFKEVQEGNPIAIHSLYHNSLGEKSASEVNQILANLLHNKILSLQDPTDTNALRWILSVFADYDLPLFYKVRKEEALLAVVQSLDFKISSSTGRCWEFFRYEFHQYNQAREIIEAKLNKMLGVPDTIPLRYVASSLNHEKFLIRPMNQSDNERFAEAVKHSCLAQFFSPLTDLTPGYGTVYHNCLEITDNSWNQLKKLIKEHNPWEKFKLLSEAWSQNEPFSNVSLLPKELIPMIVKNLL